MRVLLCAAVTIAIHLLLGWEWTILGGLLCGWLLPERGGWWGMAAVGGAWAVLVAFNGLAAPGPVGSMLQTTGTILGNLPAWLVVVLTVLIGILLGGLGGAIGSRLTRLAPAAPTETHP